MKRIQMYLPLPRALIYYKIRGSGTPVVMLHGFPLDHNVMEGSLEPIFKKLKGFKRIYLDLPTMGRSGATNKMTSSKRILEALCEFVSVVTRNEKIVLIGYSYGAYLARALAADMPEKIKGMILIAPVVIPDPSKRDLPRHKIAVGKGLEVKLASDLEKDIFSKLVIRNKSVWRKVKKYIVPSFGKGNKFLQKILWEKGYAAPPSALKFRKKLTSPVLIITGRNDSTVGYKDIEKIVSNFPSSVHFNLKDAGHNLVFEQQKKIVAVILEWLRSI